MTYYKKTPGGVLIPFAPSIVSGQFSDADLGHKCCVAGEYMLTVRHADGTVKQETPWFDNLILDNGLNLLGSGGYGTSGGSSAAVVIGQGTAAPSASQTALQALSQTTTTRISTVTSVGGAPNYVYTETNINRFPVGSLNGNYTEVGIGWTATNLFSRALIMPDGVTAGSISVQPTEQLDVTYRISSWVPITDWGGVVNISGTNYTVTGRRARAANAPNPSALGMLSGRVDAPWSISTYNGAIGGAITAIPSGSTGGPQTSFTNPSYVNNSYQRLYSAVWQTGTGNVAGGIAAIVTEDFNSFATPWTGHVQYGFSPALPKDVNKVLTLNFVVSWARRP